MLFRTITAAALSLSLALPALAADATYTVKKGQHLTWIAKQNGTTVAAMIVANEAELNANYDKQCARLSDSFRNRTSNKGALKGGKFYCNDRFTRGYAHTLNAGLVLKVAPTEAPKSIEETVIDIKGNNVTLVIDVTVSMNDKISKTASFYHAALKQHKKVTAVYFYADGRVDRLENTGVVRIQEELVKRSNGGVENTFGALKEAAKDKPDAIVVVSDEVGDDWGKWEGVKDLPPVIAHCVSSNPGSDCRDSFQRVARETGGKYIEGYSSMARN